MRDTLVRVTADLNGHVVVETYTQDDGSEIFLQGYPSRSGLKATR